jgi:hypothetical protein
MASLYFCFLLLWLTLSDLAEFRCFFLDSAVGLSFVTWVWFWA